MFRLNQSSDTKSVFLASAHLSWHELRKVTAAVALTASAEVSHTHTHTCTCTRAHTHTPRPGPAQWSDPWRRTNRILWRRSSSGTNVRAADRSAHTHTDTLRTNRGQFRNSGKFFCLRGAIDQRLREWVFRTWCQWRGGDLNLFSGVCNYKRRSIGSIWIEPNHRASRRNTVWLRLLSTVSLTGWGPQVLRFDLGHFRSFRIWFSEMMTGERWKGSI